MPFKDLLKRYKGEEEEKSASASRSNHSYNAPTNAQQENKQPQQQDLDVPEFTFMRTTTSTQEIISPPSYPGDRTNNANTGAEDMNKKDSPKRMSRFRRHSNVDKERDPSAGAGAAGASSLGRASAETPREEKRLSQRLHLRNRSRSGSTASSRSVNLPADLPDVSTMSVGGEEENWEKRATLLARGNPNAASSSSTGAGSGGGGGLERPTSGMHRRTPSQEEIKTGDDDIQAAIRLHESGDLTQSTKMFGRLADPEGANNALSQVLYGLALRHGWGIEKNEGEGMRYLSLAASNSAGVEEEALRAGMKKGGGQKGELTLAIFELANCFRNGWGVKRDPVAAKQYYETAANMGDTDAMNEVAWCYLEGFGCKKDKFRAAQYLRLAEEKGAGTVGNTWIWKDKYGGLKKS